MRQFIVGAWVLLAGVAAADDNPYAGWSGQPGLVAVSGMADLRERIAERHPGRDVRSAGLLGPSFALYRMGEGGGGAGITLGPALVAARGDMHHAVLPLAAGVRVQAFRIATHATYAGLAVERLFVQGDALASGRTGVALTFGVEYLKPAGVGWGMQAGAHTATVRVRATAAGGETHARPARLRFGGFYLF